MTATRTELAALVARGLSQRAIARELGVSLKVVQTLLTRFELRTTATSGPPRTFTDEALQQAVSAATSWESLRLALATPDGVTPGHRSVRVAAERLQLDTSHFTGHPGLLPVQAAAALPVGASPLSDQFAEFMAASWHAANGARVSLTTGARYDLVADYGGQLQRVQVKRAGFRSSGTSWIANLTTQRYSADGNQTANGRRVVLPYAPDEVDEFFLVCGDMTMYRVPFEAVAGWKSASLPGRLAAYLVDFSAITSSLVE